MGLAAALPVLRARCVHVTTLATLTLNTAAAARVVWPPSTNATTGLRKSKNKLVPCLLASAQPQA